MRIYSFCVMQSATRTLQLDVKKELLLLVHGRTRLTHVCPSGQNTLPHLSFSSALISKIIRLTKITRSSPNRMVVYRCLDQCSICVTFDRVDTFVTVLHPLSVHRLYTSLCDLVSHIRGIW